MKKMDRRGFLLGGSSTLLLAPELSPAQSKVEPDPDAGVSAPEDLMKEHGVLRRCLLIYEAGMARINRKNDVAPTIFSETAGIIRKFVEGYHELNEEKYIFPEFDRANKLVELVSTLRAQHEAGRRVTSRIVALSSDNAFKDPKQRDELVQACRAFIRMYRPHAAREDSVLFVALRTILNPEQVLKLGDRMEEGEKKVLGEEGFERTVDQVATIEKKLNIHDLGQFTPRKDQ